MTILLYIMLGLIIGSISGMLGIGGGVLLVPALVWFFHFDHNKAIGTTLAILVPPIGLMAALEYYRRDEINVQAAAFIALAFVVGCYGGAKLVPLVPVHFLRLMFGLMLIYIAVRFMFASDPDADAVSAFVGLLAVGLAWLGFLGLRLLGRRHAPPRSLGDTIAGLKRPEQSGTDYYI